MGKLQAVLIEDDEDLAVIFAQALTDGGFQVSTFYSGETGLVHLAQHVPALLLVDLNLPGISGQTVLRQLQGDARFADTLFMVVTANHLVAAEVAEELPPERILIKPVTYSQLRDMTGRLKTLIS